MFWSTKDLETACRIAANLARQQDDPNTDHAEALEAAARCFKFSNGTDKQGNLLLSIPNTARKRERKPSKAKEK